MNEQVKNKYSETILDAEYLQRIKPRLDNTHWFLRITEHKGKPLPVLVVKERLYANGEWDKRDIPASQSMLKERGLIYGQSMRRCLPVIRIITSRVCDSSGVPLELQRFFPNGRILFRGNLPLNEEAGAKLSLIFKLQERILDMDRVELLAWRIDRFSQEEALYWLTRATHYGVTASRWAQAGMRIMLGGQPGDKGIIRTLDKMRR